MLRPDLSWTEDATSEQDAQLAVRIASNLCDRLLASADCHRIIYAALPHSALFDNAEAKVVAAADRAKGFDVEVRRNRPNAYIADDYAVFARILPAVFRAGRPEVTLLAFCEDQTVGQNADRSNRLTALSEKGAAATGIQHVVMHYDSDDLVELF